MLKNYFLIAVRSLFRNKTVSFINIAGFAVSMSICLLLILIVVDQFSYDDFHSKKDRIFRVITERTQNNEYVWETATTAYQIKQYVDDFSGVEKSTAVVRRFGNIAEWENRSIPFRGNYTDNNFLQLFDFPLSKGNRSNALSLPNSVVLTDQLATKLFGDEDPLNKVITVENTGEFIVTGVLAEFPGKTHLSFDALASTDFLTSNVADSTANENLRRWSNIYDSYVYFLMQDGADPQDLDALYQKAQGDNYDPEGEFSYKFRSQALTGITPGPLLSNNMGFGLPDFFIYIMLSIALVVLLSASFNYANLTTARAINRAKEIGVRKVVGASRRQVFLQFITEAVLVAVIAFVFADLAVQFLLPGLNNYLASLGAPVSFNETPWLYAWFLVFVLLAGLFAGFFPAYFFSRTNPIVALKRAIRLDLLASRLGFRRIDIRKVLVVIQFTFTILFVITLITIYQQTRFVMTSDHGFTTEQLINIHLQGQPYTAFKGSVENMSAVRQIASTTHLPALGTNNTMTLFPENEEKEVVMSYFAVDEGYLETLRLELLAGSNFSGRMPETEQYILVNEAAVDALGYSGPADAIGRFVPAESGELEILGVVKDFHYERLDERIGPMGLRYQPDWANHAVLRIDEVNQRAALEEIEARWKELTNRPFEYTYFEDDLRLSYGHFEALLVLLGYVTLITVSIACMGLLGMVIYHIQHKTKELGIRKTLGANAFNMLTTVSKGFIILIMISYLIASPLAYFINISWLESSAYRIDFGLPIFLIGLLVILLLVGITIGGQIYRAMHINPVDSLRNE